MAFDLGECSVVCRDALLDGQERTIITNYEDAKGRYAEFGVDTGAAIEGFEGIPHIPALLTG